VTRQAAYNFYFRTQKRANSNRIEDLLKYIKSAPRSGHPRRVEPGSIIAIRIREQVHGPLAFQQQEEAVNFIYKRARDYKLLNNAGPLQPLDAKQVHNII
jgi:hypothetical protein